MALPRTINTCSLYLAAQVPNYTFSTFTAIRRSMANSASAPSLLDDDTEKLHDIKLVKKTPVNHDTRLFRFALPSPEQHLGICVGQHIGLSGPVDGEDVLHWYTPLSCDTEEDRGNLELLIKIYFPSHPEFPKGGRLTQLLENMKEGDTVKLRGPRGKIRYLGRGRFVVDDKESGEVRDFTVNKVNMVAGGSGLAPMLQLLRAKSRDPDCPLQTALLFANLSEDDIMMREELEMLKERGTLNKLWYTIDTPPSDWQYDTGYITDTMLRQNLFAPSEDTLTLMCGRKAMTRGLVQPLLERIGHEQSRICKY